MFFFLLQHWRTLLTVGLAAAILSTIASFLITEKYASEVILFPAESSTISSSLSGQSGSVGELMKFGDEEKAGHLLQILNSNSIRTRISRKYDLMGHYDIKENARYPQTRLRNAYKNRVSFEKTKYGSVRIEVLDHSPDTAAAIANDIAALVDSTQNSIQKRRAEEVLKALKSKYAELEKEIRVMEDSLKLIREKGVNDYESQSEVFNEHLAKAILKDDQNAFDRLSNRMDSLSKYGGTYQSLHNKLEFAIERMSNLKEKYEQARIDANQVISHKFVVNKAFPSDKKSYPIRWLIVVVSTIATLLLASILLLLRNSFKNNQSENDK